MLPSHLMEVVITELTEELLPLALYCPLTVGHEEKVERPAIPKYRVVLVLVFYPQRKAPAPIYAAGLREARGHTHLVLVMGNLVVVTRHKLRYTHQGLGAALVVQVHVTITPARVQVRTKVALVVVVAVAEQLVIMVTSARLVEVMRV